MSTRVIDSEALVATYDPPGDIDARQQVAEWRRVQQYVKDHPDEGRVAVGNALDLPPERVRSWLDGGKPDAIHGLHIAEQCGWLDLDPDDPIGRRLAVCMTGIYACGSIDRRWVPAWCPETPPAKERLLEALMGVGIQTRHRHTKSSTRTTELTVGKDGAVFGRCLVAAGAPKGAMNESNSPPLPERLLESGRETRIQCAELFLLERGTTYEEKDTITIQTSNRTQAYRESVGWLFRSLTAKPVSVDTNVTISAAATRDLESLLQIPTRDGGTNAPEGSDFARRTSR